MDYENMSPERAHHLAPMQALPPLTTAGLVALFTNVLAFVNSNIDVQVLEATVIASQHDGLSFSAALSAVQTNLSAIVKNPMFLVPASFLLGLLHQTNQAPA